MDKEENIVMVKDINNTTKISSGSAWPGSKFDSLGFGYHTTAVLGDRLFFYANDGIAGTELWSTDGTEIGTYMASPDVFFTNVHHNISCFDSLLYLGSFISHLKCSGYDVYRMLRFMLHR